MKTGKDAGTISAQVLGCFYYRLFLILSPRSRLWGLGVQLHPCSIPGATSKEATSQGFLHRRSRLQPSRTVPPTRFLCWTHSELRWLSGYLTFRRRSPAFFFAPKDKRLLSLARIIAVLECASIFSLRLNKKFPDEKPRAEQSAANVEHGTGDGGRGQSHDGHRCCCAPSFLSLGVPRAT